MARALQPSTGPGEVLGPCLLRPPVIRPYPAVPPQAAAYTLRWEGHFQGGHRDIPRAKKMGRRLTLCQTYTPNMDVAAHTATLLLESPC